jgi:hypothetical protein
MTSLLLFFQIHPPLIIFSYPLVDKGQGCYPYQYGVPARAKRSGDPTYGYRRSLSLQKLNDCFVRNPSDFTLHHLNA